jgi:hypothetical protein
LPAYDPHGFALVALIPDFETTPEWRATLASPDYADWRDSPLDQERIRTAIAKRLIRSLRDLKVRELTLAGNPFWVELSVNVVRSHHSWHQSGRIQLYAMRSLGYRLALETVSDTEKSRLRHIVHNALLHKIDVGAGEEFRPLVVIARAVATKSLIKQLEDRIRDAPTRSVRINAQRMLDGINGKPYRPYRAYT